mgnify:CR=1 FL=1
MLRVYVSQLCAVCSIYFMSLCFWVVFFFFQAEDGIRDLVRSRGLGDVYKRQAKLRAADVRRFIARQLGDSPLHSAAAQVATALRLSLIHI